MYKVVGDNVIAIPSELTRITLVPPENEEDMIWRAPWILSKTSKSVYRLLECLWIPCMYLEPEERKKYDEILVLRNGGRGSDIIIPTLTVGYGEIEYRINILNCKGTGVIESKVKEKGESLVEHRRGFTITNSVISRQEYDYGRPYGGVTVEAAIKSEVLEEQVMLNNDLSHAPYAMVIRIPEKIQRKIDEYNAKNIYQREYSRDSFGYSWVDGDLAQVKRFSTTNLRMNFPKDRGFHKIVKENPNRLRWLEPENLAKLLGRCDGKYENFLNKIKAEGKLGDFFGHIGRNRTIDGLLVDGENLKFHPTIEHTDLREIPKNTERFIKRYSKKVFEACQSEIYEILGTYNDAKKELNTGKPLIIPS